MQTGTKREYSQDAPMVSKKIKQNDKAAAIEIALKSNSEIKERIEKEVKETEKTIQRLQSTANIHEAAEAILKFMNAHQTGLTSVLHTLSGDKIGAIVVGLFAGCVPTSDSEKIRLVLEELVGKDVLCEFCSTVTICPGGTAYIGSTDERATVYLEPNYKNKITCKKENYIRVGKERMSFEYIFYTNSKKK